MKCDYVTDLTNNAAIVIGRDTTIMFNFYVQEGDFGVFLVYKDWTFYSLLVCVAINTSGF
jgi:hypothetical protein